MLHCIPALKNWVKYKKPESRRPIKERRDPGVTRQKIREKKSPSLAAP